MKTIIIIQIIITIISIKQMNKEILDNNLYDNGNVNIPLDDQFNLNNNNNKGKYNPRSANNDNIGEQVIQVRKKNENIPGVIDEENCFICAIG